MTITSFEAITEHGWKTVTGEEIAPGLVLHGATNGRGWTVSLASAGRAIHTLRTKRAARRFGNAIAGMADWKRPSDEIYENEFLHRRVKRLAMEMASEAVA